jgi:hypothetical protein
MEFEMDNLHNSIMEVMLFSLRILWLDQFVGKAKIQIKGLMEEDDWSMCNSLSHALSWRNQGLCLRIYRM